MKLGITQLFCIGVHLSVNNVLKMLAFILKSGLARAGENLQVWYVSIINSVHTVY